MSAIKITQRTKKKMSDKSLSPSRLLFNKMSKAGHLEDRQKSPKIVH